MIKPEGHAMCVNNTGMSIYVCVLFSLPIIFYAAACQRGGGNFITYAVLLELISFYLPCIKY